ncbi:tetratricopeptide repeat protein [Sphingobacterium sp. lm-10]|uniref:tetratricopeptide repeat protein n=1 Tax=Sphingobacterium sp. lm-10 TaxID=2944904 RepID=UPI00202145EC|nr:tetratricopeptide repeat protein [Sphingobacterium sp. lm-10]MCL7986641.1 tetratricopeptide repeat protein [Sphingobacterium sp. lm-10]
MKHIEQHWKTLTVSANDFFNTGNFEQALSNYQEALYRAEVINDHRSECLEFNIPTIQIFVISCNNLANTYIELCRLEDAERMLTRVIYYLLYLVKDGDISSDEVRNELKRAGVALMVFGQEHSDKQSQEANFQLLKEELTEYEILKK